MSVNYTTGGTSQTWPKGRTSSGGTWMRAWTFTNALVRRSTISINYFRLTLKHIFITIRSLMTYEHWNFYPKLVYCLWSAIRLSMLIVSTSQLLIVVIQILKLTILNVFLTKTWPIDGPYRGHHWICVKDLKSTHLFRSCNYIGWMLCLLILRMKLFQLNYSLF